MNPESRSKLSELIEKINWLQKNILQAGNSGPNSLEAELMIAYLEEASALLRQIKAEPLSNPQEFHERTRLAADIHTTLDQNVFSDRVIGKTSTYVPELEDSPVRAKLKAVNGVHKKPEELNATHQVSINDRFIMGNEVHSDPNPSRISDLHSVLDLNLKIGLIRDLFKGDGERYQKTIERLNAAACWEEGMQLLREAFASGFDSKSGEDAYRTLVAIFRRCFE